MTTTTTPTTPTPTPSTSGFRTYADAATLAGAGVTEIAGYAGGRTRRIAFHTPGDGTVRARMFQTDIVTWHPDRVTIDTGGYFTVSTFDGIAAALNISRARVGMVKRVPYVNGARIDPETCRVTLDILTGAEVTA